MVNININTYLTSKFNVNATAINNLLKDSPVDILIGRLELKNYPNLTEIELGNNELEELVIINCPKLTKINVVGNKITKLDIKKIKTDNDTDTGNPAPTDQLADLSIGGNTDLEEVSLEYCPELKNLKASGNRKMDKFWGLDKLKKLKGVVIEEGLVNYIVPEKLKYLKDVVGIAREFLGIDPNKPLPLKDYLDDDGYFIINFLPN